MKAIMYGGGNIGRGFIGALLAKSGYRVTFVDVVEPVVNTLNGQGRYPVRIVLGGGRFRDEWIENVGALNGNDTEAVSEAIAEADIMATAVGVNVLRFIAPNIAAGLKKRFVRTDRPLNILICENLLDANKLLASLIKANLTAEEQALFDAHVGMVETSIGRMVPVQTEQMKDGEPLRVCVEAYAFLPVDKAAFVGDIPALAGLVPYAPFDFYIERKLFVHNMGHAVCAYLGGYAGAEYIADAIAVPEIRLLTENAMLESALALGKAFHAPMDALLLHIEDLLGRFANTDLHDTCARVGGDPKRKLGPADRLVGASRLCLEQGVYPAFISAGTAGALYRYLHESGEAQGRENAANALAALAGETAGGELMRAVLPFYELLLSGEPIGAVRLAADRLRKDNLGSVI